MKVVKVKRFSFVTFTCKTVREYIVAPPPEEPPIIVISKRPQPDAHVSGVDVSAILDVACKVAKRYKRRCWWADIDDLKSEATMAALKARETWDPEVGVPYDGYAQRAAALACKTYLWKASSPVSGGLDDPRAHLADLRRAPEDEAFAQGYYHHAEAAAEAFKERWQLTVRSRIRAIASRVKGADPATITKLVLDYDAREGIPQAERRGPGSPYRTVELVRRRIRDDRGMWALARRV